ncbi:MAG: hypothetical protein U0804_02690 [Gemmataceae bacterium]
MGRRAGDGESGDPPSGAADDGYDDPYGDGRNSRHASYVVRLVGQAFGCQAVPYGSILPTLDCDPDDGSAWVRFEDAAGLNEVTVRGKRLGLIYDKLTEAKRLCIRVTGKTVVAITIDKVEDAAEA